MKCDESDKNAPWVFLVAGGYEQERRFSEGVLRETRDRRFLNVMTLGHEDGLPFILKDERCRQRPFAVVGYVHDRKILRELERRAVPCVLFGKPDGTAARRGGVVCATDNRAIGRMAADYFAGQRRYAAAAYLETVPWRDAEDWARERREAFEAALRDHGLAYAGVHVLIRGGYSPLLMRDRFAAFAAALPKPLALFACNDEAARYAALCCAGMGLRLPEDVAILGVDDDPAFCETAPVSISSVALETVRLGRSALSVALAMLRGETPDRTMILCPPSHVAERASTSAAPLEDLFVGRAVDFISANADRALSVDEVATACGASRRYLERRFRALTGRTILETIHAKRLALVEDLLRRPRLSIQAIALRAGFVDLSSLCSLFRRAHGCSMRAWRKARRELR